MATFSTQDGGKVERESCFACKGKGHSHVSRPTSGTRRSPESRRCPVCGGTGALPDVVEIVLRSKQRPELYAQYHEDTHILDELGIEMTAKGMRGSPSALRQLAKWIAQDYHSVTGFQTVKAPLKREMRCVVDRILGSVGPQDLWDANIQDRFA